MPTVRLPTVIGYVDLRSRMMSNQWHLLAAGEPLATLIRVPTRHVSVVRLPDGSTYELIPEGWGSIVAHSDGDEIGRAERMSWLGRSWELSGTGFAVGLTSDPLPRRWSLRLGSEPVARISGGPINYNRLRLHTDISLPIVAVALVWHVLARPWEAAAAPRVMVPTDTSQRWRIVDE